MTTTTQTPVTMYKELRAQGQSQKEACYALIAAGVDIDDATEICWMVEEGRTPPKWQHADGTPTQAAVDWHRDAEVA